VFEVASVLKLFLETFCIPDEETLVILASATLMFFLSIELFFSGTFFSTASFLMINGF